MDRQKVGDRSGVRSMISAFFFSPRFATTASVASIVGCISAFYFHQASQRAPELTYSLSPAKTAIVRSGDAYGLKVTANGNEVEDDVTAIQVAIWNAGNQSIREQQVLQPLIFKTRNAAPIINARIREQTREVVGMKLDESNVDTGVLRVDWKILEKNDGGVVQLIVADGDRAAVAADAVIEGQEGIVLASPLTGIGFLSFLLGPLFGVFLMGPIIVRAASLELDPPKMLSGTKFGAFYSDIVPALIAGLSGGLVIVVYFAITDYLNSWSVSPFGF